MKKQDKQNEYIMNTLDELVTEDNKIWSIEKDFDYEFIYKVIKPLYSEIKAHV